MFLAVGTREHKKKKKKYPNFFLEKLRQDRACEGEGGYENQVEKKNVKKKRVIFSTHTEITTPRFFSFVLTFLKECGSRFLSFERCPGWKTFFF